MLALRDAVPSRMPLAWAEFATLRKSLLKIGARVVEKAARIRIHFASACPDAALFRLLAGRLAGARPRCHDDGDRVDPLRADRGEIEPVVDEAPVGEAPAVVAPGRVGHVAAQECAPVEDARVGAADGFLDGARRLALRLGEAQGLVHGLVPGLLLGGRVNRGLCGHAGIAIARSGVHDFAGAAGIEARWRVAPIARFRTVLVFRIAVIGRVAGVTGISAATVRGWIALVLRMAVIGGIAVAGSGLRARRVAAAPGSRAVVPAPVVLGFRQAVVGLLDAQSLPRLSVGWQGEARVAQQSVGDELRGALPTFRIAPAPPRVVLQSAGQHHASNCRLDEIGVGIRDPLRRIADLAAVARERLAAGVGADRQAQRQAAEEGLIAEQCGDAVAEAVRGLLAGPGCGRCHHDFLHHRRAARPPTCPMTF